MDRNYLSNFGGGGNSEDQAMRPFISAITSDRDVAEAVKNKPEMEVILVRGCSAHSGQLAVQNQSAGGHNPDPNCGVPTEEVIVNQVGGAQAGQSLSREKRPEFTSVPEYSKKWARRGGWLIISIKAKYLVRGDVGQAGWVCQYNAPCTASFVKHPNPIATKVLDAD